MSETLKKPADPVPTVEHKTEFLPGELQALCDATDEAIKAGGGFGWINLPARDVLERYWNGVIVMPARTLFVAKLDGTICGTCQLIQNPPNNEAQSHAVQLTTNFVAPWARGHGLATMLIEAAEAHAKKEGFKVINLDVRETLTDAMKLYESLGYQRLGEHPCYAVVEGKTLKGYYYCKVLG